ncbi:hypothetical protein [Phenylobacterium sp.]|uniref:hypothetical protein n=1 Tax=Phenylobacterium sp. TaxID=1871053 RepID=UPI0035B01665
MDRWRSHFAKYADRYVMVGGVACEQLMDEAGLRFRLTNDFDVVLLVELLDASFAEAFWGFIEAGGYERREKAEGGKLYRFENPTMPDYPQMIELFSRAPEGFELAQGSHLTPLPIDEAAASLSAILLDSGYYDYLQANARQIDGLPLLSEAGMIPFKARAYLDLSSRKAAGENIDSKKVKKHRNDVFRVLQLLPEDASYSVPDAIKADMSAFLDAVAKDDSFKPADFDVKLPPDVAISRLARAFDL